MSGSSEILNQEFFEPTGPHCNRDCEGKNCGQRDEEELSSRKGSRELGQQLTTKDLTHSSSTDIPVARGYLPTIVQSISNDHSNASASRILAVGLERLCPDVEPLPPALYFNSNSAISMRVVPMLRIPRVVPGSCQ